MALCDDLAALNGHAPDIGGDQNAGRTVFADDLNRSANGAQWAHQPQIEKLVTAVTAPDKALRENLRIDGGMVRPT